QPQGAIDPALLAPVVQGTPDRLDRVQSAVRSIESEDQRLLEERTADATSARRQVWGSFTLAFVLDFLLLVSAFELLVRAARDRERIAAGADEIAVLNRQLTE